MNPLTKLLEWIRTNEMSLLLSIICVICEAPITTEVLITFKLGYWHAWMCCFALSFTIVYFTIRKSWMALWFALFEVVVCGFFFCNQIGWEWALLPALGFTFIMPFSIFAYSQDINFTKPSKSILDTAKEYAEDELLKD